MSNTPLHQACVDLAWSLWTELGVPGVDRSHRGVLMDPEPLIVWSPALLEHEPRLRDLVFRWCVSHAAQISASRLRGLLSQATATEREAFGAFSSSLRAAQGVHWPQSDAPESATPWPQPHESGPLPLPIARPALLPFRLRALVGVGTRADVLGVLLSAPERWRTAGELASRLGYTKRNIARVLSDLNAAGVLDSYSEANRRPYRLARPPELAAVVDSGELHTPDWSARLRLLGQLTELERQHSDSSAGVRRVEANNFREGAAQSALAGGLPSPPVTAGRPDAWDLVMAWGLGCAL